MLVRLEGGDTLTVEFKVTDPKPGYISLDKKYHDMKFESVEAYKFGMRLICTDVRLYDHILQQIEDHLKENHKEFK